MVHIEFQSPEGEGKETVLIYEEGAPYPLEAISEGLSKGFKVVPLKVSNLSEKTSKAALEELERYLTNNRVRPSILLAISSASFIAQYWASYFPKTVRSIMLVDPITRAHPTLKVKISSKIDSYLPLGVPLRSNLPGFDGLPILHRVRCPSLIITSKDASQYELEQGSLIASRVSSGTLISSPHSKGDKEYAGWMFEQLSQFETVPTKFPQRRLAV